PRWARFPSACHLRPEPPAENEVSRSRTSAATCPKGRSLMARLTAPGSRRTVRGATSRAALRCALFRSAAAPAPDDSGRPPPAAKAERQRACAADTPVTTAPEATQRWSKLTGTPPNVPPHYSDSAPSGQDLPGHPAPPR